ncbi:MAG: hypothetical protein AAFO89_07050, partial [Planctomycetota bacterium]
MTDGMTRVCACAAMLFALGATAQNDGIVYVDDDAAPGGNGESWNTAYRFLQDALYPSDDVAELVAEIRVAGGVYLPDRSELSPNGTGARTASFVLPDGVSILGGFAGLADPANPDDRAFDAF